MNSISVFCGSSFGDHPSFREQANLLGLTLAQENITLVYGGAKVGLMGEVAESCLKNGGKVIGVLPRFLQTKEIAYEGLSELILCETMHERKMKMFELSNGFIAIPGGFGTLDEVMEILTWQQLGLHKFPIGFLNINGFYNHLELLFETMEKHKLLKPENKSMALFEKDLTTLLERMKTYRAPQVHKWVSETQA